MRRVQSVYFCNNANATDIAFPKRRISGGEAVKNLKVSQGERSDERSERSE